MKALAILILILTLAACQSRSRAPEYEIELPASPAQPDHLYDIEAFRYGIEQLITDQFPDTEEAATPDGR